MVLFDCWLVLFVYLFIFWFGLVCFRSTEAVATATVLSFLDEGNFDFINRYSFVIKYFNFKTRFCCVVVPIITKPINNKTQNINKQNKIK